MSIVKPELMLFNQPVFQSSVEKGMWVDVQPCNAIGKGPIEFIVPGGIEYIDLNDTELYIMAKIVKADGTPYPDGADVAFVNNSMHSLFSDVFVSLGSEVIEGGDSVYSIKAMISTLFNFSESAMKTQLPSAGFIKDQSGRMEDKDNRGFIERKCSGSKEFQGKLFVDIFSQGQYLLNNIDLKIKLVRAKNEFCLTHYMENERPKVIIENALLYVRKCRINPEIMLQHMTALEKENMARYIIDRVEIQTFTIAATTKSFRKDNLFYGKNPKSVIFGMLSNDAYNGQYNKNPFNFQHFQLNYLVLYVNGEPIPFQPFTPDFANKKCLREYNSLYMSSGNAGRDFALPFDYQEFMDGYTLFKFNLTPDLMNNAQDPSFSSNVRLDVKFEEGLKVSINIVLMATFFSMIQIDTMRNVFCDFKA